MYKDLKWIVVPGGPGMSNIYLKYAFPKVFKASKLHFYNALGSPESLRPDATIKEMVEQIVLESENGDADFGLITHSFGNYLAMRLLEQGHNRLKAIIMINPIPFRFDEWQEALNKIVAKVPQEILSKLSELSNLPDNGVSAFRLIYPYYIGKQSNFLPVNVPFDMISCNSIAEKVKDFNDLNLVANSKIPLFRVVGDADPFYIDKNTMKETTYLLKDVGHYPFFEDFYRFKEAILKIEEKVRIV